MIGKTDHWTLCIATRGRPGPLRRLLSDLSRQSAQPNRLVIVDAEPESGEALAVLEDHRLCPRTRAIYIPSNHKNLPYQRYLGWRVAHGCDWLLYLDDDLRLPQTDAIERILEPLRDGPPFPAGVTADITGCLGGEESRKARSQAAGASFARAAGLLVRAFGASRATPPGGLTPTGERRPLAVTGQSLGDVEWLRGGVMAFSLRALTRDCFSEDVFALHHAGCGLGEDTILSRRAGSRGRLLLAGSVRVEHPDSGRSETYPTEGFAAGYAASYSRRLINDNYRAFNPPQWTDRLALLKSYAGRGVLHLARAGIAIEWQAWSYAIGYAWGAIRGVLYGPNPRRCSPEIHWWADAEKALSGIVVRTHSLAS